MTDNPLTPESLWEARRTIHWLINQISDLGILHRVYLILDHAYKAK